MFKCPICNKMAKDEAELVKCVTACAKKAEDKKKEEANKAKAAQIAKDKDNIRLTYLKLVNDIKRFKGDHNIDAEVKIDSKTNTSTLSFGSGAVKKEEPKTKSEDMAQEELNKAIEEFAKEFASIFNL